MSAKSSPSDEVLDFLLSAPTLEQITTLKASDTVQEKLRYLLDGSPLNDLERAELDEFLRVEHFIRLLKIRALEKLAETQPKVV